MNDEHSGMTINDEAKVRLALEKIERAQNLIIGAAQDLCPVHGFCDEWSAAGPVHGAVKDYWYRVSGRLGELSREEAAPVSRRGRRETRRGMTDQ